MTMSQCRHVEMSHWSHAQPKPHIKPKEGSPPARKQQSPSTRCHVVTMTLPVIEPASQQSGLSGALSLRIANVAWLKYALHVIRSHSLRLAGERRCGALVWAMPHFTLRATSASFICRQSGASESSVRLVVKCMWLFTSICGEHRYVFMPSLRA